MQRFFVRRVLGVVVVTLVLGSLGTGRLLRPAQAAAGFAYRCGIHFCLDGNLYYFAGANTYDLFTYGDGSSTGSPELIETQFMNKTRIDAHFARLQADQVAVLRLWMFSHEAWHGFETAKGVYSEAQFRLFDYIIESAKAHDVKLIPTFENYWEAYGGIDSRLAWEGVTGGHPGRWKFFSRTHCAGCFTSYKNYLNYALNRVNHYSGIAYKDEPTIFAWDLMNEPRYQDATPNENATGTTLRAWVDEMAAYVKSIDPNHMVGVGLEAHESRYGFGGDEGNPFVYIQQSPYIDMTSAHPYPTEEWAHLSIEQTKALVRTWIQESHTLVGKPFYMGEFNTHTGVRSDWWSAIFGEMEASGGDGSGFWWYDDRQPSNDSKFGVAQGAPELAVFRQHAAAMQAKNVPNGPTPTPGGPTLTPRPSATPSPTIDPSTILRVQYKAQNTLPQDSEFTPYFMLRNTSTSSNVPLSELKLRYWYTIDGEKPEQYACFWAQVGCANVTASLVKLAAPVAGADHYLEIGFTSAAGMLMAGGTSGEIQGRVNKNDWSNYNESDDYSFDATKTALVDWERVTLYRNGQRVWGVEPSGLLPTATRTGLPTPSATFVPLVTNTATARPTTATPTSTSGSGPDLIIQSMAIGQQAPSCTSTSLGVRVVIKNQGTSAAASFVVTVNGVQQTVSGLAAGQTASLWFSGYNYSTPNTATADATNLIAEGNESNNTLSQMLPIPTPPRACTATHTATSIVVPPTNTATPLAPTPTHTPTASSGSLKVQYRNADNAAGDNQIKPHLQVVNTGTSSVALSELTLRYWYTNDGTAAQSYSCDYAVVGCAQLRALFATVARPGTDRYLELSFTTGAGNLAPGASTGQIQNRLNKTDWSNYSETGDYSFDPTKTAFADWSRVTLYRNGTLVWGSEP